MEQTKPKRKVGRPKTLNPEHALQVALRSYWDEGIHGMSLNEVCRRAKIAKPGLYREFGGEDGLMTAVLQQYVKQEVSQITRLFEMDLTAKTVLERYADGLMMGGERPLGCLMAEMSLAYDDLGPGTQQVFLQEKKTFLAQVERWVRRSQEQGTLRAIVSAREAAQHIASQMVFVALRARRGTPPKQLRAELALSLTGYLDKPLWS